MPRATTKERGYDHAHQAERARWTPTVKAGAAHCTEPVCVEPTRWIHPDAPWDLAHDRAGGGYHGPAHRRCNRSEGATHGNHQRRNRAHHPRPRPWHSRTW